MIQHEADLHIFFGFAKAHFGWPVFTHDFRYTQKAQMCCTES